MLRKPADYALSHYTYKHRKGREPLSFADALDVESDRLRVEEQCILSRDGCYSHDYWAYSHKSREIYADRILRRQTVFFASSLSVRHQREFLC